jgi:DNA polymerase III subunit gamma/tau
VLGHTPLERVVEAVDLLGTRDLAGLLGPRPGVVRRRPRPAPLHARPRPAPAGPARPAGRAGPAGPGRRDRRPAPAAPGADAALPQAALLRGVDLLAETLAEQRQGSPRLPLELALATLATPGADGDVVELADRVARLESESAASPSEPAASPSGPIVDLDGFAPHWAGILELVRGRSRRCHAMFEPATPAGLSGGILTLRYAQRYASFHAANAQKAEFSDVLRDAIESATGSRLKVQVVIEGQDARRRPTPPSVTPDDARTPVLDDRPAADREPVPDHPAAPGAIADPTAGPPAATGSDGRAEHTAAAGSAPAAASDGPADAVEDPAAAEEAEVREAELEGTPTPDPEAVDDLLSTELGATLLEERQPPAPED